MVLRLSLVSFDFYGEGISSFIRPFQYLLRRLCDFYLDSVYILVFLLEKKILFFNYVNMCMYVCGFVHVGPCVHEDQP